MYVQDEQNSTRMVKILTLQFDKYIHSHSATYSISLNTCQCIWNKYSLRWQNSTGILKFYRQVMIIEMFHIIINCCWLVAESAIIDKCKVLFRILLQQWNGAKERNKKCEDLLTPPLGKISHNAPLSKMVVLIAVDGLQ